jgi:hypothetical protein
VWPKSIFLVGPTPRDKDTPSWRPHALELLEEFGFDGTVMVPEDAPGMPDIWTGEGTFSREEMRLIGRAQVRWEWWALAQAQCVCAWVPRSMKTMPALTTNIELGILLSLHNGKVFVGAPHDAEKMGYLRQMCEDHRFFSLAFKPKQAVVEFEGSFDMTLPELLCEVLANM